MLRKIENWVRVNQWDYNYKNYYFYFIYYLLKK